MTKERKIGRVNWYGGYNNKTRRENNYGFLKTIDGDSIYVHESELLCPPSKLFSGQWVTFNLTAEERGPTASAVNLTVDESNVSAILDFLKLKEINISVRLQLCFKLSLDMNKPWFPLIKDIIEEYELSSTHENIFFPKSWCDIEPDSPIYQILPKKIREDRFNKEYKKVEPSIVTLSSEVTHVLREYKSMSPQDKDLALMWARSDAPYENAKMLSARAAELITIEFLSELQFKVTDVAKHQISGESNLWQTHDLCMNSNSPIDVKNARCTINGNTFVEYTIKRFKKDHLNQDVSIFGVLSPYLKLEDFSRDTVKPNQPIKILGLTTYDLVKSLQLEFTKRALTVDFGESTKWPIWIFNNNLMWFPNQTEAISKFSNFTGFFGHDNWFPRETNLIPALVISGTKLPAYYDKQLANWQKWFIKKIIEKSQNGELTLPWLYLFTFQHFIEAITNISSAEKKQYKPNGYYKLLFYSERNNLFSQLSTAHRPASLVDPLCIIWKLISTLDEIWQNRYSTNLTNIRRFYLKGEGLLSGYDNNNNKISIIAYCGGYISGKGKCGNSPLIIGKNVTCEVCKMLVCDKCGYCCERCKNLKALNNW